MKFYLFADRDLYSYPDTSILFYPMTEKYTTFDITGHDFHAAAGSAMYYDTAGVYSEVEYITGPSGVAGTAAFLGKDIRAGIYRREYASLIIFLPIYFIIYFFIFI